jgi:phage-related protein
VSTIADLVIGVRADTGAAEKDISSFGSKVSKGFGKALLPATAALGVMGVIGKQAFDNLQDGAKNAHQTEQVIKTTGGAANVTAKHVDGLAMSLRKKAGVDDDVVHAGENMLLTFTNVRNEVGKGNAIFDRATSTVLDMSQALGQDTKSSAIQLGKALNDPVKGISALARVGVSFTQGQKDQIKALVQGKSALQALGDMGLKVTAPAQKALAEATKAGLSPTQALEKAHITLSAAQLKAYKAATEGGHTLEAQKIILHELGKEFGGAATNIDPMQRSLANMKLNAIDLASSLLQSLMPAMQVVVGIFTKATAVMQDHQTATKIVVGIVAGLAVGIIAVNAAMKLYAAGQLIVKAATTAWTAAQWLLNAALSANPVGIVIIALIALGVAIAALWVKSQTFRTIVLGVWSSLKSAVSSTVSFLEGLWQRFGDRIMSVARGAFGVVASIVKGQLDVIRGVVNVVTGLIHGDWSRVWDGMKQIVSGALSSATAVIRAVGPAIVGAALSLGKGIAEGVIHGVGDLAGSLAGKLKGEISSAISSAKGFLHINSPSKLVAQEIGSPIGEGIIYGFLTGTANLPATISAKLRSALDAAKQQVDAARGTFSASFGGLASVADQAFDAINATAKTKSEKLLDKLVSAHDVAAFKKNLGDARQGVTDAKSALTAFNANGNADGSMTPAEVAQKQRDLGAAVTAAQAQVDDLLYQQKVAALQKSSAAERLNLNATIAIRKLHFDAALAQLNKSLAKEGASSGKATQAVLKLLGAYGVDFQGVGRSMGVAWVQGLKESIEGAAKGAGKLSGTIASAAASVHVPGFASGVRNFDGGMAVVGENGPELVNLPRGSSVFSNSQSRGMFGGGVNVEHMEVRSDTDVRLVARELAMRLGG